MNMLHSLPQPIGSCVGGDQVEFQLGNWSMQQTMFKLEACQRGYKVVNTSADGKTFSHDAQTCAICSKGEECLRPWCVECFPCAPGFYKTAVGTDSCVACPADTFLEKAGATDLNLCLACQLKSSTAGARGQITRHACVCDMEYYLRASGDVGDETLLCQTCPKGAQCENRECGLRNANFSCGKSSIVGTWILDSSTGHYKLTSCPAGYEMRTTEEQGSVDLQQCHKCLDNQYIIDPKNDFCTKCPLGLTCKGDADITPVTQNSTWMPEGGVYRLKACPTGYSMQIDQLDLHQVGILKRKLFSEFE